VHVRLSPNQSRQFICSAGAGTKKDLRTSGERSAELDEYAGKQAWDDYYEPMFSFVALGLCNVNQMQKRLRHSVTNAYD